MKTADYDAPLFLPSDRTAVPASHGGANSGFGSTMLLLIFLWTTIHLTGRDTLGFGWGHNGSGELGNGSIIDSTVPVLLTEGDRPPSLGWKEVSSGGAHNLAIATDGNCYAWGNNSFGQLGDVSSDYRTVPTRVARGEIPDSVVVLHVAAGGTHSLALASNGKIYAWGANDFGQSGSDEHLNRALPREVPVGAIPSNARIIQIAAGWRHSLALASDGAVYAWGENSAGQLGDGSVNSTGTPVASIGGTTFFTRIAGGRSHSLAIDSNGTVHAWGANNFGQLGDDTRIPHRLPEPIHDAALLGPARLISAGWNHSLALTEDGHVFSWGSNSEGQLGDGTVQDRLLPVPVLLPASFLPMGLVAANGQWSLFLSADGEILGCGANDASQLGNGSRAKGVLPVQIPLGGFGQKFVATGIYAGANHALALAEDLLTLRPPVVPTIERVGTYGEPMTIGDFLLGDHLSSVSVSGLPEGLSADTVSGQITGVPRQVGTFSVQVTAGNSAGTGKGIVRIRINPRDLFAGGLTALSREYDGTRMVEVAGTAFLSPPLDGDRVEIDGVASGMTEDSHVGTEKPVTLSGLTLTGAESSRYRLQYPLLQVDFAPRLLKVSGMGPFVKSYDGTIDAIFTGTSSIPDVIAGDDVSLSGVPLAQYDSPGVGSNHWVMVSGFELSGHDSGDYRLENPRLAGRIDPLILSVTGFSARDRTYDGSLNADIMGIGSLTGTLPGEEVVIAGTPIGRLASKAAGPQMAMILGLSLTGIHADHYSLPTILVPVPIRPRPISIVGLSVVDRGFDGSLAVYVAGTPSLDGLVVGDQVELQGSAVGVFEDASIGTNKPVQVSGFSLSGTDGKNYELRHLQLHGAILDTNPLLPELAVAGLSVVNRDYDGSCSAILSGHPILQGVLPGDVVTLNGAMSACFSSPDAGTGKSVRISGLFLAGPDAQKYRLSPPVLSGSIFPRPLSVGGLVAHSKVEDGNVKALLTGNPVVLDKLPGDDLALDGTAIGCFDSERPGFRRPVSISGLVLIGSASSNYLPSMPMLKASIWRQEPEGKTQQLTGWGANQFGRLGIGTELSSSFPVPAVSGAKPERSRWLQLTAGGGHTLGLADDGNAYAWGLNSNGQLGDGTTQEQLTPVQVTQGDIPSGVSIEQVSAGGNHTLALGSDGKVYAWGSNDYGQLGNGDMENSTTARRVVSESIPEGVVLTEVHAGWDFSLALASNGQLFAWGRNDFGQLGNGTNSSQLTPQPVTAAGVRFCRMAAGRFHSLAIASNGKAWAWGANSLGQLGTGTTDPRALPAPILPGEMPTQTTVLEVAAGWAHSVLIGDDNRVYSVGANSSGQLGNGSQYNQRLPVTVIGLPTNSAVRSVSAGASFTLVLTEDGKLFGWGANESGQLGTGYVSARQNVVSVNSGSWGSEIVPGEISAGAQHSIAVVDGPLQFQPPVIQPSKTQITYGTPLSLPIQTTGSPVLNFSASGMPEGLILDFTNGIIHGIPRHVGTFSIQITVSNSVGSRSGFVILEVNKKTISVSGLNVSDRVYDGTAFVAISGIPDLSGVEPGDDVGITGFSKGAFLSIHAGSNIPVSVSGLTLVGKQASNYQLEGQMIRGSILPREVFIAGLGNNGVITKEYDGTTEAVLAGTPYLEGIIPGDDIGLNGAPRGFYDNRSVGSSHRVTLSGYTLIGSASTDYCLNLNKVYDGSILPKSLAVTGLEAVDRLFDGTVSATVFGAAKLSPGVSEEEVFLVGSPTGTFLSAEIGSFKSVIISGLGIGGADAGNYRISLPVLNASITNHPLLAVILPSGRISLSQRALPGFLPGVEATHDLTAGGLWLPSLSLPVLEDGTWHWEFEMDRRLGSRFFRPLSPVKAPDKP